MSGAPDDRLPSHILAIGIAGPPNSSEQRQWEVARWENVYSYANNQYNAVEQRWIVADEKASKYLSILGIAIGAGALTGTHIARIFARQDGYLDGAFMLAAFLSACFVVASFFCYLRAIELKSVPAQPTRADMFTFLEGTQHLEVLLNLGRETLKAADEARISLETKQEWADNGFQLMKLAAICGLVAYLVFFAIQVREVSADASRRHSMPSTSSTTQETE